MDNIKDNIIFNTIDNGIIILDDELNILAWNRWLEIKTDINSEKIVGKNILEEFPYIDSKKLQRKIKLVLTANIASYISVNPHKFLIKIKSNVIMGKVFKYMRQDITIVPYDFEKKLVCLYIYDNTKLYESQEKLKKLNLELRELSIRDPLTHLYNRRYFSDMSKSMQKIALRNDHNLAVVLMDIDNFKMINDSYGHQVGDDVIKAVANILENNCRKSDLLARYGGEEFILLLYNTSIDFAKNIAENIRENCQNYFIKNGNSEILFTLSFGVSNFNSSDRDNIEATINRADKALYLAKQNGKNRVEILV